MTPFERAAQAGHDMAALLGTERVLWNSDSPPWFILNEETGAVFYVGDRDERDALVEQWQHTHRDDLAEISAPGISKVCVAKSRRRRGRPSCPAVARRRQALVEILREIQPAGVRQTFYQAETRGLVEKTEAGCDAVQRDLVHLRRERRIPYGWITDGTRWRYKPRSYTGPEQLLEDAARLYRKDLWQRSPVHVEVWVEKDALRGSIYPVTAKYDVPLLPARGYSSLSFLYEAAEEITAIGKPAFIYHLGDFDHWGIDAAKKIDQTLREMAPEAEIHFERLAVTLEQIDEWNLPKRVAKKVGAGKNFAHDFAVELDAIAPHELRRLVSDAIEQHLPQHELAVLMKAEESERSILLGRVRQRGGNSGVAEVAADHAATVEI